MIRFLGYLVARYNNTSQLYLFLLDQLSRLLNEKVNYHITKEETEALKSEMIS